jgi:hypothetical protein
MIGASVSTLIGAEVVGGGTTIGGMIGASVSTLIGDEVGGLAIAIGTLV